MESSWRRSDRPVRVGVSSCLLGAAVRWDGGHKRDAFVAGSLGRFVEWASVCPELEAGMGVPREPVHLVRREGEVRMIGVESAADHTLAMRRWAAHRVRELAREELSGYVLKKDSPSCGLERVRIRDGRGAPARVGRGLFAAALVDAFPHLPIEEEGRLTDPRLRENFVERVFAYHRLQALWRSRWTIGALVAFHTAHKLQLMAHAPEAYRRLGRLVATAKTLARPVLRERYEDGFMEGLRAAATPGRHANVLQHMFGYLTDVLTADERAEMLGLIDDHRRGLVPLVAPLVLLRHHARRCDSRYLLGQTFLDPHPKELMLRNHV